VSFVDRVVWSPDSDYGVDSEPAFDVNVSSAPDARPGVVSLRDFATFDVDCGGPSTVSVTVKMDHLADLGLSREELCAAV
jgi:hypothetical protein